MTNLNVNNKNGCCRSRSPNSVVTERQQEAPKAAPAKFWLEKAMYNAVETMIVEKVYAGKIIQSNEETFCVQESENQLIVPRYISSMQSYTECDCRLLFRNIAENVRILHDQDVVHRRLNLDNLQIDQSGRIFLKDLRYIKRCKDHESIVAFSGYCKSFYAFKAPEAEGDGAHGKPADIWSIGVILYVLLSGIPPFLGTGQELVSNKHSANFEYVTTLPSPQAKDLLESMLQGDPRKRPTIDQILQHNWMYQDDEALATFDLSLAHELLTDWSS